MTEKKFSTAWNGSVNPGKQRLYRYNAPLHIQQKFMHTHLSKELRQKYGVRNLQLRVGDKIKILRGQFAKKEGKVERVILKRERVIVTGIENIKKDGTKLPFPLHPSNLIILDLNLEDKKRKNKLSSDKSKNNSPEKKVNPVIKKETINKRK
ncbi:MAG: 50S ribosomal protein L24 [Nanoarchaeota archaeon]